MFLAKVQEFASSLKHFTGLSSDALFIYAGLIIYFIVAAIHKRQLKSNFAIIATVVLAFVIEIFNARADIFGRGYWRIWESIHSIQYDFLALCDLGYGTFSGMERLVFLLNPLMIQIVFIFHNVDLRRPFQQKFFVEAPLNVYQVA